MVAPHKRGLVARSFVKIPGSGSCSDAGMVYKDFSLVCDAAAVAAARYRPLPAVLQAQHSRLSSSSADAAFLRKTAAIVDPLAEGARVRAGAGAPASVRTSALPARDRSSAGGQLKRLRSHPSEGNGEEADAPPRAKAPRVIRIVVGGTGAVSPAPDRVAAAVLVPMPSDDARQAVRLVAARRPLLLSVETLRRLMDHRKRFLQQNQTRLQREGAGPSA